MATDRPAVRLDRDGTAIEGGGHLRRPDRLEFRLGALAALRRLQRRSALVLVTSQGGIAQGLDTASEAEAVNAHAVDVPARNAITITAVCVRPHPGADGRRCIKPRPHLLQPASRRRGLDLSHSSAVGDHPHGAEPAARAGARSGISVLTEHGRKHADDAPPDTSGAATSEQAPELTLAAGGGASG